MSAQALNSSSERDSWAQASWLRALRAVADIDRPPARTLPALMEGLCERFGDAPALLAGDRCISFSAFANRMSHYAHWALSQDIGPGDAVCLLMPTNFDYLPMWLGVTRIGGLVALLNVNLRGAALAHAINSVSARSIIVDGSLTETFESARAHLHQKIAVWVCGESAGLADARPLDRDIGVSVRDRLPERGIGLGDRALYIFTSGTTGLPKAAVVSHRRVLAWSLWFSGLLGAEPTDRMYNCLPLYHSVGGVVATGATLLGGGSVFLKEKFSARQFWPEVKAQKCTLFQYIGELGRYLVNAPACVEERGHSLRLCCGNGLRPDVWTQFQARFAIPRILEFYASTEGNISLYNVEGRIGSIGRLPAFAPRGKSIALVKVDLDSEPIRDARGFCAPCGTDEVGEALGAIASDPARGAAFEGYTSAVDTQKKILRNVFAAGDAWFRTGDLMRKDRDGYFYFVDRLGDTFRWKGENVSTLEVAEVLCSYPGVREAVVYGVTIPNAEGRAGMALIVADDEIDLVELQSRLEERLPSYARPIFLRLRSGAEITETYKYKKAPLQQEAYDPRIVTDALYVLDPGSAAYRPLDAAAFDRIASGELRW